MTDLKKGTAAMAAAYLWWGLMPFYWFFLNGIPSIEIIAYRILFSFITVLVFLAATKNLKVFGVLRDWKKGLLIAGGALMLAINWTVYIYSISIGLYSQASMGYYLTPIVSILLGLIFLKEKMTRKQTLAFMLVSIGVAYYIFTQGFVPYISLVLAATFGTYGLYKKTAGLTSAQSMALETGFLLPAGLAVLAVIQSGKGMALASGGFTTVILIMLAGVMTLIPLILFSEGAQRIPLVRVGFLQYIAPSLMLFAGLVLGEKFNINQLVCFVFIWSGLAVYTASNIKKGRDKDAGKDNMRHTAGE
ncbi:MAG: EamA family transporter RarD [Clostridia bacterium]|nr:EamA family transporter RarD [Clostridia bacterium]